MKTIRKFKSWRKISFLITARAIPSKRQVKLGNEEENIIIDIHSDLSEHCDEDGELNLMWFFVNFRCEKKGQLNR